MATAVHFLGLYDNRSADERVLQAVVCTGNPNPRIKSRLRRDDGGGSAAGFQYSLDNKCHYNNTSAMRWARSAIQIKLRF
jgi:hypothetical protein